MKATPKPLRAWAGMALLLGSTAYAGEWSGYAAFEGRFFSEDPLDSRQHRNSVSLSMQPEYYAEWEGGAQSIRFTPFVRWDEGDDERTHADIRELAWWKVAADWEIRAGIRKVFWGVTESQHLVDIINQTDLVENPDGEDKLGQPMVNLALIRDWGTLDVFVLPYFRERTFPGVEGRLRTALPVDADQAQYESAAQAHRIDGAVRWSHYFGVWDVGLSHFYGTSRDPRLLPGVNGNGEPVLIPYYEIIHQTGIDVQATVDAWLWKLEAIHRIGQEKTYNAATAGLEYTLFGIGGSSADLGVVAEYLYDDRGEGGSSLLEDDTFVGLRLTLNDEHSSEALLGGIVDNSGDGIALSLEAQRRIGSNWKLELETRIYQDIKEDALMSAFRNDDYVQVDLAYYF